jgi:hypothetical protein
MTLAISARPLYNLNQFPLVEGSKAVQALFHPPPPRMLPISAVDRCRGQKGAREHPYVTPRARYSHSEL